MNSFIRDDFLLQSAAARDLYRGYAQAEPIYNYHCHVPPEQIASNRSEEHTSELQSLSHLESRLLFGNDTATTEIYPLSLPDALPICDLYRGYAQAEPIYDYHCHVPPEQIASN